MASRLSPLRNCGSQVTRTGLRASDLGQFQYFETSLSPRGDGAHPFGHLLVPCSHR